MRGFRDVLRPGGTLVLTAPNAWHVRGRLQALVRGFHADPWTGAGRADAGARAVVLPWGFAQLHLLLARHGFGDITLHNVAEAGRRGWLDRLLGWPARRYCQTRLKHAQDEDSRHFWRQAGSDPVSYTHLDVYKRQPTDRSSSATWRDNVDLGTPRAAAARLKLCVLATSTKSSMPCRCV